MSWDAAYAPEAERTVLDLASRPMPQRRTEAGTWARIGAAAASLYTGAAQGVNESVRASYRSMTAGADAMMLRQQQEADDFTAEAIFQRRLDLDAERAQIDAQLRSAVDYWRPDPATASTAGNIVHEVSRMLGKVGTAALVTRNPAAVAGVVGADEGVTGYIELRDEGVDEATAAKVGAVRGVATAASVLLPATAATTLGKVGLVAAGGPGSFIAENALAREILRDADYDALAERFDPFDPVGLAVSTVVPAVVAVAAGRGKPSQTAVDAAQVVARQSEAQRHSLGDPASPVDGQAHAKALDATRAAIDEGRPINAAAVAPIDLARARAEIEPLQKVIDELQADAPLVRAVDEIAANEPRAEVRSDGPDVITERVQQLLTERPDLEVRLGDAKDAPTVSASDLLRQADDEIRMAETEASAYRAAVACFIARGAA